MKKFTLVMMLLASVIASAQNVINGKVIDGFDEPIPGVSVAVQGTSDSTISDFDGNFTITTSKDFPFTLEAKSVGFDPITYVVSSGDSDVTIVLENITFLDELVVSASRAPERLFEW